MKKFVFLFIFVHCILYIENCYSQWQQCNGIYGGYVTDLASSGNNIYVVTGDIFWNPIYSGVFFTSNNGADWVQTNLFDKKVLSITTLGNNVYAGVLYDGVFRSTNNGMNWIQSPLGVMHVKALSTLGDILLAGSLNFYGVLLSTNYGANWTSTSLGSFSINSLYTVDNKILAGTYHFGVYISNDTGKTWSQSDLPYRVQSFTSLNNYIFAGTDSNGVYRSTNGGLNWGSCGLFYKTAYSLTTLGNNIFAGTGFDAWEIKNGGLYKSSNNGNNWSLVAFNNEVVWSLLTHNNNLFAGTDGLGVQMSSNSGVNWSETAFRGATINSIVTAGNNYFALETSHGAIWHESRIFKSTNDGLNWIKLPSINSDTIFSIYSKNNYIFAGAYLRGIHLSTDFGENWIHVCDNSNIYAFLSLGNTIYAGGNRFARSTNGGFNWTYNLVDITFNLSTLTFMCNPANDTIFFAGSKYGAGVWKSTNFGYNWVQTSLTNQNISCLAVIGNYIFAGSNNSGSSYIYRSSDYGINWTIELTGREILSMAVYGNNLFAGTGFIGTPNVSGVYLTTDFGSNWSWKNEGFIVNPWINSLLISNDYIFAGAEGYSVWRRPLSELTGIISTKEPIPSEYYLYYNYPNPFNPKTNIKYQIANNNYVTLKIYDVLGKEITTLVNEKQSPGVYEVTFDGSNLPSGVYFYKLTCQEQEDFSDIKKMLLIK